LDCGHGLPFSLHFGSSQREKGRAVKNDRSPEKSDQNADSMLISLFGWRSLFTTLPFSLPEEPTTKQSGKQ
jgi:hypothetical protein